MSARVFHHIQRTKALIAVAACGVEINTQRATNFAESIEGTSCKKCLKKLQAKTEIPKEKEYKQDKKAIKHLKKIRKQAVRYKDHIMKTQGAGSIRTKHALDLLEIVSTMLQDEKDGWTDLKSK